MTAQSCLGDATASANAVPRYSTVLITTQDKWPELLPTLLGNVTGEFEERVKVATLQALGYMCDDVSPPPPSLPPRIYLSIPIRCLGVKRLKAPTRTVRIVS